MLLALPWPGRISASAVLRPQASWPVFAPAGARIEALPFQHGDVVQAGQALVTLFTPDLVTREKALKARMAQPRWQSAMSGFDDEMRQGLKGTQQRLVTTTAELAGVQAEGKQFVPIAPFTGHFWLADPELSAGQWVAKRETMGVLVRQDAPWRVETWLDEDAVQRLQVGQKAFFTTDGGSHKSLQLTVAAIDRDAARLLPRHELAGTLGGHIVTRAKEGQLLPERALYRVTLDVPELPEQLRLHTWRGQLTVRTDGSSPAARYARQVLVREFGFKRAMTRESSSFQEIEKYFFISKW